ncbi:unnamed protein product [Polarella glacialis]|uniref:IRG-type G domain-containing protein n=1 Tax=Polarella glacialis TaxID=89957 RepID=A0A813LKA5_POLGL|nr:unnamed protein product [Polarella glacialis]
MITAVRREAPLETVSRDTAIMRVATTAECQSIKTSAAEFTKEALRAQHAVWGHLLVVALPLCEVERREADLQKREAELEAEEAEQRRLKDARENYPQPDWLEEVDDYMNVAVVGNSGVGKSLLINKLRKLRPHAEGWAPVGVNETTMRPQMYPFPNQHSVRLWDLPGAGTTAVPAATYLQDMGLRYFDRVIVVTAGRFTEMEVALRAELESHCVPYYLVRTKVDQDIWNNREDNFADQPKTLQIIREDLEQKHSVKSHCLYLVSSRDPEEFDMPRLMADLFPCLRKQLQQLDPLAPSFCPAGSPQALGVVTAAAAPPAWHDSWALPIALSVIIAGLQGRWGDSYSASYLVQNSSCHVTLSTGSNAVVILSQQDGVVWWCSRWYINEEALLKARRNRELRWTPVNLQDKPLVWYWCD